MCIDKENMSPYRKKLWEAQQKIAKEANQLVAAAVLIQDLMEREDIFADTDNLRTAIQLAELRVNRISDLEDELCAVEREYEDGVPPDKPEKTVMTNGKLALVGKSDLPPIGA